MNARNTLALLGMFGILISATFAQAGDAICSSNKPSGPLGSRPQCSGPAKPADVQAMIQEYQRECEQFQLRQKEMEQQLKDAPAQDRDRIREQLRLQMEQFKQEQARVREQLRDQADRQRDQLREHNRIMDRVSNPGNNQDGSNGQNGGSRGR